MGRTELGPKPDQIALFNRLAAAVIFTSSGLRDLRAVSANRLAQSGSWPHSISGDLPIALVRVSGVHDEAIVSQLLQWRMYTRRQGLNLDLVILDERPASLSINYEKNFRRDLLARCSASRTVCSFWLRARARHRLHPTPLSRLRRRFAAVHPRS
jgi:cellobiose phosphorylase